MIFLKKSVLRAACGLSLLFGPILGLMLPALPVWANDSDKLKAALTESVSAQLKTLKDPAVSLTVVSRDGILLNQAQGLKPDDYVPLGRIGELFPALLVLAQTGQGVYSLDEPVNYLLDAYAVSEPFGPITVRHLLERSSGLPLREAGIYTTLPSKSPKLLELLKQDLKPAVTAPGRNLTVTSFSELLLGQLAARAGKQELPKLIQQQVLAPLKLDSAVRLPDVKARDMTIEGHDSSGYAYPRMRASAREIHGWQAQPQALVPLLQALLGQEPKALGPKPLGQLLSRSLNSSKDLPTSSLGLLEGSILGHRYFYLDSDWFGHTSRLAVFPDRGIAFFLHYDSSAPGLKQVWTKQFVNQILSPAFVAAKSTAGQTNTLASGPYALSVRDSHSLLRVLDLFATSELVAGEQMIWNGTIWARSSDQIWLDADSRMLSIGPDGEIHEGFDEHRSFRPLAPMRQVPAQLAIAAVFVLLFLSVLVRAGRFLAAYEPVLEPVVLEPLTEPVSDLEGLPESSENVDQATAALPENAPPETLNETAPELLPETPHASWDIPGLATLISSLGLLFTVGIQPVVMHTGHIGDHLAFVMRNDPNGWLLAWLAMPLFALIGGLILLALMSVEWKSRPWQGLEKWHYLGLILSLPFWAAWLTSWNLIGFRF